MIPAIRSELRKIYTIRTTYAYIAMALFFMILIAFYAKGYKLTPAELGNPHHIATSVIIAGLQLPIIFGSFVAILLMTHEYRYNTIMYTLTASNSRTKVLIAKIIAISLFGVLFTFAVIAGLVGLAYLGVAVHGHTLIHQIIPYGDILWRTMFFGWSSILAALLLATLIRNQIGAVVALFVIPTIEQILGGLFLKNNVNYLPFTSSDAILTHPEKGSLSYSHAAIVFSAYLVVGWIVAWILFLRRDAH